MPQTIQEVKADYEKELAVLQAWKTRMGATGPDDMIPPESVMSEAYKEGWRKYLNFVMQIGLDMIQICDTGNVANLKKKLKDDATIYDELAATAKAKGLLSLASMLAWEAQSRKELANDIL